MVAINTRKYLGQLKNIDNRIKNKQREADRWHDISLSTSAQGYESDKIQTSLYPVDKMAEAVAKAIDCENECRELSVKLINLKAVIERQIDGVDDELYYNILHSVYVEGKSISETAVNESYSYKQLKRHLNAALDCFEAKYGYSYLSD